MKIAVFLPNWLGDLAMATPALRALRRRFGPETRIVGVMRPYLADVLAGTDWLDEQWHFDPRAEDRQLRGGAVARRMRGERFDIAVLMTNSLRTAWAAWRGGAVRRVGYVRYGRGPLLTDKLHPRREGHWLSQCHPRRIAPEPMVETYLRLAYAIGCREESPRLELATTDADERSADAVFARLGLGGACSLLKKSPSESLGATAGLSSSEITGIDTGTAGQASSGTLFRQPARPVAAINSSGAYGGSKLWPVEYFGRLARRIVDELDYDVLVFCGPKEREIASQVVRLAEPEKGDSPPFPARVVSMDDQPMDLGTAKACISRCRVMVSTDSGPRHVAAALGLPVVTLFGPMLPVWSENPTQRAKNLVLDLDCIGCHKRVCPLGHHRCMRDLSVETVFDALCEILDRPRPTDAAL